MTVYFRISLVLALCALLQLPIHGKDDKATWADVALALNRLDKTCQAHPVPDEELAAFSRKVDEAMPRHTAGQMARIVEALDTLTASLDGAAASADAIHAASLKVRLVPHVHAIGSKSAPVAIVSSLYATKAAANGPLTVRVVLPGDAGAIEVSFDAAAVKDANLSLPIPLDGVVPGACRVEIVTADGCAIFKTPWYLVSRPLAAVRKANEERLDKIAPESKVMKQALGACRARNSLLIDAPSGKKLIEFMTDPVRLGIELDAEIAALEKGVDPFRLRKGDYWRTITVGENITIPLRVYAPPSIDEAKPLPLLIVYSGPIAAPHMNIESFGAGKLGKLADEKGFIVAAPAIPRYQANRRNQKTSLADDAFDALLEVLEAEYPIAPGRVFTLGHATGGISATTAGKKNLDKVLAVCCISSTTLGYSVKEKIPTTLLMTGTEDRISPPNRVEGISIVALGREIPIHYKAIENQGRVMAAGQGLAHAVEWLLAQEREVEEEE